MIVKNEAHVIERLLESVSKIIDYFVIVDTGSTDKTVQNIIDFSNKNELSGEIHFRSWVNFGHNRQEALELAVASGICEKILFIDADEELIIADESVFAHLENGTNYMLFKQLNNIQYAVLSLIDISQNKWRWVGPVHEYLECIEGVGNKKILDNTYIKCYAGQGGRSKNVAIKEKYLEDARHLENALNTDPNNARFTFYLAQSYRDAGEYSLAFQHYDKRASMLGWDQETFMAKYEIAKLSVTLGMSGNEVEAHHLNAWKYRPHRIEPLWHLARFYRDKKNYHMAYVYSKAGLNITKTDDILFVSREIYDWMMLDEFSISAYWIGQVHEAKKALLKILDEKKYSSSHHERLIKNLSFM